MKNRLFFILIFITGCSSETAPVPDSTEPEPPQNIAKPMAPGNDLTFEDISNQDQSLTDPWDGEWQPVDLSEDFEPTVVETGQGNDPFILPGNIPLSIREKWFSKNRDGLEELLTPSNCE